ncbi:MarR family winged helix-turn-helix transcriptional regulator [Streptomyces subrutilus]|uniref:MarR family winged helix-turn-helix transcriptional regulator n=1 Tax=Streptomyces subrutilus TaxID=36818 RepID=UPI0033F38AF8
MLEILWGRSQAALPQGPVSSSQLRALTVIEQRAGVNLRDLGEVLGSSPPAVSRLCDRLEAAGLLQRSLSRTSRREVELRLSRRGQAVLENTRTRRAQELDQVLLRMSPEMREALAESLAAFRAAATAHVGLDGVDSGDLLSDSA